jgi:hypothetical protein
MVRGFPAAWKHGRCCGSNGGREKVAATHERTSPKKGKGTTSDGNGAAIVVLKKTARQTAGTDREPIAF